MRRWRWPIAVVGLVLIAVLWAKFAYGLPWSDFGAEAGSVRTVEEARWNKLHADGSVLAVVARDRWGLSAYVGGAGLSLTLYEKDGSGTWHMRRDAAADACELEKLGVPSGDAEFLDAHIHRADPTIPFVADCAADFYSPKTS